jgi:hypothetical protein
VLGGRQQTSLQHAATTCAACCGTMHNAAADPGGVNRPPSQTAAQVQPSGPGSRMHCWPCPRQQVHATSSCSCKLLGVISCCTACLVLLLNACLAVTSPILLATPTHPYLFIVPLMPLSNPPGPQAPEAPAPQGRAHCSHHTHHTPAAPDHHHHHHQQQQQRRPCTPPHRRVSRGSSRGRRCRECGV